MADATRVATRSTVHAPGFVTASPAAARGRHRHVARTRRWLPVCVVAFRGGRASAEDRPRAPRRAPAVVDHAVGGPAGHLCRGIAHRPRRRRSRTRRRCSPARRRAHARHRLRVAGRCVHLGRGRSRGCSRHHAGARCGRAGRTRRVPPRYDRDRRADRGGDARGRLPRDADVAATVAAGDPRQRGAARARGAWRPCRSPTRRDTSGAARCSTWRGTSSGPAR